MSPINTIKIHEIKEEAALYLFTRRHQVLVCFEDVSECFFDILLLHAGEHCRRQEQRQTPLLPADKQFIKTRVEWKTVRLLNDD